jgi:hypothetical protein
LFVSLGSYVSAFKNQQRRLQDEKAGRKSVMSEFKTFAQNGGFGPSFGNTNHPTFEEKVRYKYLNIIYINSVSRLIRRRKRNPIQGLFVKQINIKSKNKNVMVPNQRHLRHLYQNINGYELFYF